MRSIVPPAFRNSKAKVVWQEPKSLEANINEALGIWQATLINQFSLEQEPLSGLFQTYHFPPSFTNCGTTRGWSQPEIEQRNWDMSTHSQTVRAVVPFCGSLIQNKLWPNEEQVWGWQQNAPRGNVFPPPTRFSSPPFESNAVMGNWVQRPINEPVQPPVPPSAIPPPQRSRLQNVWGGTPAVNNTVNGMYLSPPTVKYSVRFLPSSLCQISEIPNGLTQWNPSTGSNGATVTVVPKPQFAQKFVNRSSPPNTFNSYSQFMGDNAIWQDPEDEVRKWQRDIVTVAWGDPGKQQKEIKRWIIPVGKEYDNSDNESGVRVIIPLGWGDLPLKSSNNNAAPILANSLPAFVINLVAHTLWIVLDWHCMLFWIFFSEIFFETVRLGWDNRSASGTVKSIIIPTLWKILSEHQPPSLENGWIPPDSMGNATMSASTQQIVEQLHQTVAKGTISWFTVDYQYKKITRRYFD
ncbi:unnamed protein product [Brugia pahangi]|uniref:Reverse transcriptase domain-containing protein n=1 Tax=Brugia pahangi TaxID=6280 RepID=A0A0N4TZU4_BRUPA|nr:unnamed protein product [Brugia pahangi]